MCPKKLNDELIWFNPKYILPTQLECMIKLMTTFEGPNQTAADWPNVDVHVHDFGGDESTRFAAHISSLKLSFAVTYANVVDKFKSKGYILKKDLFVIPYDWRKAPTFIDNTYDEMKSLIEKVKIRSGEKVTLFGFSLGGFVAQQFLEKMTPEWKAKHVSQVVYLSPSFIGSTDNLYYEWTKKSPIMEFYNSRAMRTAIASWASLHAHMPRQSIWGDFPVVFGPNGEKYYPKDIKTLMKEHNVIEEQFMNMYLKSEHELSRMPMEPGIKTTILMNSGIQTVESLSFQKGWDAMPTKLYGAGDGRMSSEPIKAICGLWKNTTCIDFNNSNEEFSHQPLISNDHVLEMVFNITTYKKPVFQTGETFV